MSSDKENIDKDPLQKLYSAHVQENLALHRHKTDLDHAKLKKLRELNFDEDMFLRKYEKFTNPGSARSRRSSVDASIMRVSEVNQVASHALSRSDSHAGISQKSLTRSTITNDCPYSLETWNSMVDTEKNIIDAYKKKLLFGGSGQNDKKSNLGKKQTLKPINMQNPTIELTKDGFDEEIQMAQGGFRKRSSTSESAELKASIKDLQNRRRSIDSSNMSTLRLPSIRTLKQGGKRKKKKLSSSTSSLESSEDECCDSGRDTSNSNSAGSHKGILQKRSPRPIANASVFIHEDPDPPNSARRNRRSSFDISTLMEEDNAYLESLRRKTRSPSVSFLPIIPQSPIQMNRENQASVQSVRWDMDSPVINTINDSNAPSIHTDSPRMSRRPSLTTATLKLMVDTHHGAAKLRYIARLANEMEKEEVAKLPPGERPVIDEKVNKEESPEKTYDELKNCRYLRVNEKN